MFSSLQVWIQTGKSIAALRDDYRQAVNGIRTHLVQYSQPNKLMFIGELHGSTFRPSMVCFYSII